MKNSISELSLFLTLVLLTGATSLASPGPTNSAGRPLRGAPIRPAPQTNRTVRAGISNVLAASAATAPTNLVRIPQMAPRKFAAEGYTPVNFTVLARFILAVPAPDPGPNPPSKPLWDEVKQQIPIEVQELDGTRIAVTGYMLPVALSDGLTSEFLLLRNQSVCCFGLVPRVNELILVQTVGRGVRPMSDVPVSVAGTLRLKWIGEGGYLTGIYEMSAEKVEPAREP